MDTESVKPDYTSIQKVINEAVDQKLMLPEFQRAFVWSLEQSKDLFDSLMRGIFIGTFVMAKPQFDLMCRPIDPRPRGGKGSRAKIDHKFYQSHDFEAEKTVVVLDGQQRITSLFRVLKGIDKIYFIFKNPNNLPSPNTEINSIEQFIDSLSVKPIDNLFSIELSKVYSCHTWKDKDIKTKIFDPIADEYEFLKYDFELRERYLELLLDLKRVFYDLVNDKTLLSVFFLNMGIEKFCMFFERSNSRGTELSFIDIITAKIYKDFKLDKNIRDFRENHPDVFFDNSIVEAFVRYIAYLKAGQVDKKTILTHLDGNDFNEHWKDITALYIKSCNFLISQKFIFKIDWVPSYTMFIPIIHFLKKIPHKDFSQISASQTKLFKFWFWGSLLNSRYAGGMMGSTNDIIVDDCKKLESIASGHTFSKDYLKQFRFDFTVDDLCDLTSNGAIFIGIMSIMNHKNLALKNLGNNNPIDFHNSINIHHIFPSKYLEKNFDNESFENENSNSILNKMFTEKITNIKFGEKKPSEYLRLLNNSDISQSLASHCITNPISLIDGTITFKEFIEQRGKAIVNLIDNEVNYVKLELIEEYEKQSE